MTVEDVYEVFFAVSPSVRMSCEWVLPRRTLLELAPECKWSSVLPLTLLGLPVVVDDRAEMHLRPMVEETIC